MWLNIGKGNIWDKNKKTELLVPPYISCLGLSNDTFCEARSATNTKIQDAKVTPVGTSKLVKLEKNARKHARLVTTYARFSTRVSVIQYAMHER